MDDPDLLMNLARTRSKELVAPPATRRFIEKPLAREYPEAYHRLVEIELMARSAYPDGNSDFVLELWLEAQEWLEELLERCNTPREMVAEVTAEGNKGLRSDLFVWSLLDKSRGMLPAEEMTMALLDVAEAAVLARMVEEGNPEGRQRSDGTTDLYWMCRAQRGNLIRVRGDVQGGFEVVRKSGTLVRPWGNPYLAGRAYSYFASSAIDSGRIEMAKKRALESVRLFEKTNFISGAAESLNILAHAELLMGISSRRLLLNFLNRYLDSHMLSKKIRRTTQINLLGVTTYMHDEIDVKSMVEDLKNQELDTVEALWVQHYKALAVFRDGNFKEAARMFHEVSTGFISQRLHNQGHFVRLFEVLSLIELENLQAAFDMAIPSTVYFSTSKFYGGVAAQKARQLLAVIRHKSLSSSVVQELIEVVLSPARRSPGRTQA